MLLSLMTLSLVFRLCRFEEFFYAHFGFFFDTENIITVRILQILPSSASLVDMSSMFTVTIIKVGFNEGRLLIAVLCS